ncbi:hypothetical protein BDA96_09G013200 [Sorghum bicolor]|uniref:Uncharacterized protein n=1 Tax=Sorghum bicolor TaxID=4558 RepID=A0A921Q6M8_SORBI|nr:hypothetical protein BDA96_09G013200 [Sorghum bicolor]
MPRGGFSGSLRSPKIDVVIDMGNPFLNRAPSTASSRSAPSAPARWPPRRPSTASTGGMFQSTGLNML